jgi:hypothetical protein
MMVRLQDFACNRIVVRDQDDGRPPTDPADRDRPEVYVTRSQGFEQRSQRIWLVIEVDW